MEPLKSIHFKILAELLRDSSRADRPIAKVLKVSQPTVTRNRHVIETRLIDGYTIVPEFGKIGFELAVLTFMKTKPECKSAEAKETTVQRLREWFMKQPNVVAAREGRGMGCDSVCVSLHASYPDYAEFARTLENDLCDLLASSEAFLIDLKAGDAVKPFHLKYLADLKPVQ